MWLAGHNPALANMLPQQLAVHVDGLLVKMPALWGILGGGTILMLLGLADDRRGLAWQLRIAVEFAVAAFCVYFLNLRFTAFIDAPWLTGLMSVFWIVALINSFKHARQHGWTERRCGGNQRFHAGRDAPNECRYAQSWTAVVCSSYAPGAGRRLAGFLKHNWPPAKIFMGDAGSYFVGYWIAIATCWQPIPVPRAPVPTPCWLRCACSRCRSMTC